MKLLISNPHKIFEQELRTIVTVWAKPDDVEVIIQQLLKVVRIGAQLGVGVALPDSSPEVWLGCPKPQCGHKMGFTLEALPAVLKMRHTCHRHGLLLKIIDTE